MRYINLTILVLMLLFIGVQYNDPDGPMWMAIYGVPAVWAGIAFFKAQILRQRVSNGLLMTCIAAAGLGMLYFWPSAPRWWSSDVWWETETAREGMGMMIVTVALLITWCIGRRV